jgi:hypothetical protein
MLTGFNTDVNHEGKTFHVQTEDKGEANPVIETLIYEGGQILASRRQDYAEKAGNGTSRETLVSLMERQHQAVVRDIRLGKYDPPESRRPFGEGIISHRSLDELVKEFIETAAAEGNLPPSPSAQRAARESQAAPVARSGKGRKAPSPRKSASAAKATEAGKGGGASPAPVEGTTAGAGKGKRGGKNTQAGKPYKIRK